MSYRRSRIRAGLVTAGLSTAVLAGSTGCSWPDVSMSPGLALGDDAAVATEEDAEATDEEPAATGPTGGTVSAAASVARVPGELDTGSTTHSLPAGDQTLLIDYWTDELASGWTAEDAKGLQLAAHLEGGDDDHEVLVTRFVATVDDGASRTLVAEDRGEFALTPPYGYGTALELTPSASDATAITVHVQFDLLVETEPGSLRYFRQTVLDRLVLPLLQEGIQ